MEDKVTGILLIEEDIWLFYVSYSIMIHKHKKKERIRLIIGTV